MRLGQRKRLAADVMTCSAKDVVFDTEKLSEIQEAITKADIRSLIKQGVISKKPLAGKSRGRSRIIKKQKKKGLRKGPGSRKGRASARTDSKRTWINKIRSQRLLLKVLYVKKVINLKVYRDFYRKAGGGFFRNKRHIKVYLGDLKK